MKQKRTKFDLEGGKRKIAPFLRSISALWIFIISYAVKKHNVLLLFFFMFFSALLLMPGKKTLGDIYSMKTFEKAFIQTIINFIYFNNKNIYDHDITFNVTYPIMKKTQPNIQSVWMEISGSGESGPIGNEIQDLTVGPSDALWVATNNGLSRLSEGKFRHFTRKNGMPHEQVLTVIPAKRGVFAGTKLGLVWFDDLLPSDKILPQFIENTQGAINSIFEYKDDFVFLISPQYEKSKIARISLDSKGCPLQNSLVFCEFNIRIRRILPGRENRILCQVPNRQWREYNIPDFEKSPNISLGKISDLSPIDILIMGDERFILTKDEVLKEVNSKIFRLKEKIDETDNSDAFLAAGHDGSNIWFGKRDNLWLLAPDSLEIVNNVKLPLGIKAKEVAEDLSGRLWVGTENKGLLMFVPNKNFAYGIPTVKASVKFKYVTLGDTLE